MARQYSKKWFWAVLLAIALVVVVWVFRQANRAKDETDVIAARREGRPIPVRTALVEEKEVEQVVGATALTMPSFTSVIRIPPSGGLAVRYVPPVTDMIMKTVSVQEGEYVQKGAPLFEANVEFFKKVVEQRESALRAAEAQLTRAQHSMLYNKMTREKEVRSAQTEVKFRTQDMENRKVPYEKLLKLIQGKGSNPLEVSDAKSKYDQARFDLDEAQRRLQWALEAVINGELQDEEELRRGIKDRDLAKIDLEETQGAVDRCSIRSPINGFVEGKIDVVAGQTVEITSPLCRVIQTDPIYVRVDFPQERMEDVQRGQRAEVSLDSFPGETFIGTVLRASAQVNPSTRSFPVIVSMSNSGNRIRTGISGFARFRKIKKTKMAPATAVIQHGDKAMAFRIENGRARLREIHVGRVVEPGIVEVLDGLAPGDEVVVYSSNFYRHYGDVSRNEGFLQDNDLVDADWRRWARRE